jgi:hypothetical protein
LSPFTPGGYLRAGGRRLGQEGTSVALELLDDHLGHCVSEAIASGGPEAEAKVAEASAAIARLVRS